MMQISVFGTGEVGRRLAGALDRLGHDVTVGTRDPAVTRSRSDDALAGWLNDHDGVRLAAFDDAARGADVIVNATNGGAAVDALAAAEEHLKGTVVVDVSNPLDFSAGFPPSLLVANTDSLAEQIQRRFPTARVVKTLNTMTNAVMVDPGSVGAGDHTVFVSGDHTEAKRTTTELLASMGWVDVLDLGDITTARGPEMAFALWVRVFQALGTGEFQFKIVRSLGEES